MTEPAWPQERCVHCNVKHAHKMAPHISAGSLPCTSCQQYSTPMTKDQMLSIMRTNVSLAGTPFTCVTCHASTTELPPLIRHLRHKHPL